MNIFVRFFNWLTNKGNNMNTNTTTPVTTSASANKKAVCAGCNDYPGTGNDLRGCITDVDNWTDLLTKRNFSVKTFKNSECTKANIKKAMSDLVNNSKAGDILVFQWSGHGTFKVDMSSPEPDHKNEAICAYDGNILDDEIRAILNGLPAGVKMTVIFDSCFSGTATRLYLGDNEKIRFMPPTNPEELALAYLPSAKSELISEEQMPEILISGCAENETSCDAYIGGKPCGALSYFATKAIRENPEGTYLQVWKAIRQNLPSYSYNQSPQLEGSTDNKNSVIFT